MSKICTVNSVAHAIGARCLGFDYRAGQIGTVLPMACYRCHVSSELRKVVQALRRGDESRHSLGALA